VKRALILTVLSVALALLGIAVACGSNPITVATIEVGAKCEIADGGDAGETCPPGQFCSKTSCLSNDGVCDTIGAGGCETSGPQCGCDGVSYYNACLRQSAHVSPLLDAACDLLTSQPCGPQRSCSVDGASCVTIVPAFLPNFGDAGSELGDASRELLGDAAPSCATVQQFLLGTFPVGACWVVPDSCPSPANRTLVGVCDPKCIDDCSAIRDGGLYFHCLPDASAN
jgi:hypothetical protein